MLCALAACGETSGRISGSISGNDSCSATEAGKRNDEIYRIDPSLEKYRAVFYDNAQKWMKKEFLNQNRTDLLTEEKDLPSEIISVIDDTEKFQNVFLSYPTEIDFQTRKIILYLFTDLNAGNGCYLTCMKPEAKTLNVSVLHGMFLADK